MPTGHPEWSRARRLAARRRRSRLALVLGLVAVGLAAILVTAATGGGDERERVDVEGGPTTSAAPPSSGAPETSAPSTVPVTPTEPTALTTEPTTAPAPTATESAAADRRGSGQAVTIAFGGDTHFESYLRTQLDADPEGMLDPIAPVLGAADLAVVNLETALTERGEPVVKDYTFRAPPAALTALRAAGVDVVSLANNHGLDYGPVGIEDALAASADRGLPVIGIGGDAAQAYAPFETTIDGQRIAVIAATQVLDSQLVSSWTATDTQGGLASAKDVDRLVAAVEAARATSDTVIVFLHWGISLETCPSSDQQSLAARLADAGADIVAGGHAHRLQGAGFLGRTFVAYGLGNFIWYAQPGPSAESGVLRVTVTGRDVDAYEWLPAAIENGVPHLYEGDEARYRVDSWNDLRDCTGLSAEPTG